jgi:hypothetical protein
MERYCARWGLVDNPTMAISTADTKRRVVLPAARPGDIFDIQSQGEGRLLLVRLETPEPGPGMSMARGVGSTRIWRSL